MRQHPSVHKTNKQTQENQKTNKRRENQYEFNSFFPLHQFAHSLVITCRADLYSK